PARVIKVLATPELQLKHVVRVREGRPQRRRVDLLGRRVTHRVHPRAVPCSASPPFRLTGTLPVMHRSFRQPHRRCFTLKTANPRPRLRLPDGNGTGPCRPRTAARHQPPGPVPAYPHPPRNLIVFHGVPGPPETNVPVAE